jgi:hypothetical protein
MLPSQGYVSQRVGIAAVEDSPLRSFK